MTKPRIALLVIDDKGMTSDAIASFDEHANGATLEELVIVDDQAHERGFCGACQHAWSLLRRSSADFDYVWHMESDFRFTRAFDLAGFASVLDAHPRVAQVACVRNPVNDVEVEAGGILGLWPAEYHQRSDDGFEWIEHAVNFTTNPSLYRRALVERAWPDPPRCEEAFGQTLIADGWRFAYAGRINDAPLVAHVGERIGFGY